MAENVVINIEANTSGLTETINLLTKMGLVEKSIAEEFQKTNAANVSSIQKGVQATTKEFEKLDKAVKGLKSDNGLAKALDVSKDVAKTGNSIQSLNAQLKSATEEARKLAFEFGIQDERAKAAANTANQLKSEISNVNAQINALTPEGKFQAIANLGGAIQGVFQVATGALQAFGVESEVATQLAQQFQGALNIVQGATQLAQLGDSLKAVQAALGLTTVATVTQTAATEGLAVAEGEQAVAAGAATVAQQGLNTAMLVNPYVAIIAGIVALTAALVAFSNQADEAKAKYRDLASEARSTQVGLEGELRSIVNQEKLALAGVDARIKAAQLEGKSAAEIGKLQKERLETERTYLNLKLKSNNTALNSDIENYNNSLKLNTEEGEALSKELGERIQKRKEYQEELITTGKLLVIENKKKELEITNDIKQQNQERSKAAKDAFNEQKKLEFDQGLQQITDKYAKIKLEEQKNYDNKEAFAIRSAELTQQELIAKKEFYEKYGKDVTKIEQDILDNFQQNLDLIPIDKLKVEAPKEDIVIIDTDKARKDIEDLAKRAKEAKDKTIEYQKEIGNLLLSFGVDQISNQFQRNTEKNIDLINEQKEAELSAIDEQSNALNSAYENRLIGKRQYEEEQKKLEDSRIAAAIKAEKKLAEERRKGEIAKRAIALFEIALNTRKAIMAVASDSTIPTAAKPFAIAAAITLGATQAAAILATPLPKYKKGTLSVGGVGTEDSELALLQPGEAVIPTDTNRKYHPAIKAIYQNKIRPEDINAFVKMRLRGDIGKGAASPVTAKMDTADLYALGRIMKKNNGVYVTNMGDLAAAFASFNNPRR